MVKRGMNATIVSIQCALQDESDLALSLQLKLICCIETLETARHRWWKRTNTIAHPFGARKGDREIEAMHHLIMASLLPDVDPINIDREQRKNQHTTERNMHFTITLERSSMQSSAVVGVFLPVNAWPTFLFSAAHLSRGIE